MRSGFFNSNITGYDEQGQPIFDRAEDAAFFAKYFSQFVGNGVFAEPGTGLMVQAKDGMDITVKAGTCFIGGYMGWLENDQQMTLATASTVYDRIDRVVARYDALQRSVELYVVQGQGSAAPVAPALVRDSDIYELALADVYVTRNATMLRQADITDQRLNESVCGLVASPVEHLETEEVTAQLTDAFDQWFRRMKDQLTEDAAGHLHAQVEALSAETKAHADDPSVHVSKADREQWNAYGNLPGSMQLWPGAQAPAGWLLCQGQAVSRTTYAKLFAVIGTVYGTGNGSTTFNVPDMRGRVAVGASGAYILGISGGEEEHTLQLEELPLHDFWMTNNKLSPEINSAFDPGSNYGMRAGHTDCGKSHNNMQPYLAMNYIIKY